MKRLILQMIGISVIAGIIGLFFVDEPLTWMKGLAFGTTFSILRLRLIDLSIKKSIKMPPKKAHNYAISQYMIRYILTAVILFISALEPSISILGTIVGLLIIKISVYLTIIIDKKKSKKLDL